jgi:hypothetical protein
MGIQFPEAMGGAGMSAVDYCICIEELARVDPSVSLSVAAHNGLGAAHIAMFGNDAQKQQYLPQIAAAASQPGLAWPDYYDQLHAIGGLGISTISKLACFFRQSFAGSPALVLDLRIMRVIAAGRWAELGPLHGLAYANAHVRYVDYLATMSAIAEAGNVSAEQIEFFLFALGEAF